MGESNGAVELTTKTPHQSLPKSDSKQEQQRRRRKRRACLACCGGCGALIILIAVILIILAFTVFKPKKPELVVKRITVEDFTGRIIFNIPPAVSLNITLGLDLSVKNPNKAAFDFYNSSATVFYRGVEIGVMPIPAGHLDAEGTTEFSSSLELLADRLLTNSRAYVDFIGGSLPISTTAHIAGRVKFLKIFKRHADTSAVCNYDISPLSSNKVLDNMQCSYDIDL